MDREPPPAAAPFFKLDIRCRLLALSGQSDRARVCPLSDQSGQRWILARNGLSAFDPGCVKTLPTVVSTQQKNRTCRLGESFMRQRHSV